MDAVLRSLAEAHTFRKGSHPSQAFYKHLDAIDHIISLLASECLFRPHSVLERPMVERLVGLCEGALDRAEEEVGGTLDLSGGEADRRATEGIIIHEGLVGEGRETRMVEPTEGTLDLHPPGAYQQIDMDRGKDKEEGDAERAGPEPELTSVAAENLPEIPMSSLSVVYCQIFYDLQLLIQRHHLLASHTPKQKSNAMYLAAIRDLIGQLRVLSLQKLDVDTRLFRSGSLTIRDIPATELAKQITLLQMTAFQRIPEREVQQRIRNEDVRLQAPHAHQLQALSLYLTHWCQYEVLYYSAHSDRESALNHLIRVAHSLSELRNYEGCKAIVSGLTALPIRRLRCFVALNKRLRNKLDSLEQLLSSRRNYAQLREALAHGTAPCIPYIALYLKGLGDGRFLEWQQGTYAETCEEKPTVQHYLLTRPFRTEDELYALSRMREAVGREQEDSPGATEMPDMLTETEVERLSFADSDRYDRLRLGLQRRQQQQEQQPLASSPLPFAAILSETDSIR